ncbi:MAG: PASTA domain-containing protein [Deltaproteobacteria bacterium]|nr:PASTA domain-containing protein [Deltaproteobacteria bacterium]
MTSGKAFFVALITAAVTSTATFFALRHLVPPKAPPASAPLPGLAPTPLATPATPPVAATAPQATVAPQATAAPQPAPQSAVPVLKGLDVPTAVRLLQQQGLMLGQTARRPSGSVPKNAIVDSDPQAGTAVQRGSAVNIVLSAGPSLKEVPSVTGRRLQSARNALSEAGFSVRLRYSYDEDRAEGLVLSQNPRAGAELKPGETVTLTINRSDE